MKAIPKNLLVLFISDGAGRLLGFLTTIVIARTLAIEGFGLISYGMAFLNYAILLINPGLTVIGAREIAKDHDNISIIAQIQSLRLIFTIVVFIFFGAGLLIFNGSIQVKHVIMLYLLTAIPFSFQLEYVFQGRQEMLVVGISRFMQALVYLVAVYVLLRIMDILGVPLAFAFSYAAASLFLMMMYGVRYGRTKLSLSLTGWRRIIQTAVPVGLATILNQMVLNLPAIILGILSTRIEIGAYSAAYKIILMLLIIERVSHYVFFPVIARQYKEKPDQLGSSLAILTKVMTVLTAFIALVCYMFAKPVISIVYGAGYERSIVVLQILLLYFLVSPLNSIYGYGLVAMEREKKFMQVIAINSIASALLMIIFIILLQASGAAIALVIGEFIGVVLMARQLLLLRRFALWKCIRSPLCALVAVGLFIYGLRSISISILYLLAASVVIFGVVIAATGHFNGNDWLRFKSSFSNKTKELP